MKTLQVRETVENCIVGTAMFGPRFEAVEVGKMAPMLRKSEDVEGLARAGFMDETVPMEMNLAHTGLIRAKMIRYQQASIVKPGWLPVDRMLRGRPSIGYLPPEILTNPNGDALEYLAKNRGESGKVAGLRGGLSDGDFWVKMADEKQYPPWLGELIGWSDFMGLDLLAPPVPVVTNDLATSPEKQAELNLVAASVMKQVPTDRRKGLLYSLHFHPSALSNPDLIREAIGGFDRAVSVQDNPYWGAHIHFTDLSLVKAPDRVEGAKEITREASRIARDAGMFTWASDVGPVGPVFLDNGAAFASYHPGMTPRRIYAGGASPDESKYGKVLGLWEYNLNDRSFVKRKGWRVDDNGIFTDTVPLAVRGERQYKPFRVEFGKPNNTAVAERLNIERAKEIIKNRNGRAGAAHVGRSTDYRIVPWAG